MEEERVSQQEQGACQEGRLPGGGEVCILQHEGGVSKGEG